jgi:hypothetical protein
MNEKPVCSSRLLVQAVDPREHRFVVAAAVDFAGDRQLHVIPYLQRERFRALPHEDTADGDCEPYETWNPS